MSSSTTTISIGSWVLVTGATGFLAGHIIGNFLERGYKVRGTVRDLAQASWLIDTHFKSYAESGNFQLVTVRDLAVDNAFDEAVKGVSAIAHVASIINLDPDPNNVVPQTASGATSILKAAIKEPMVREVVYTSSITAATVPMFGNDTRVERDTWNEAALQAAWAPPPYEPSRAMVVYMASKTAAEKAVWKFVQESNPSFTVNTVCPSGLIGEFLHKKHADGPGNWVGMVYKGDKATLDGLPAAWFIDVKDVALLHVAAVLDPRVKSARLHCWGHNSNWNEFLPVLRRLRPNKKFLEDWPESQYMGSSTDESESLDLLKKWADQDGWKPLEQTIIDGVENPYFKMFEKSASETEAQGSSVIGSLASVAGGK